MQVAIDYQCGKRLYSMNEKKILCFPSYSMLQAQGRRVFIIGELIDTEQQYVETLRLLVEVSMYVLTSYLQWSQTCYF